MSRLTRVLPFVLALFVAAGACGDDGPTETVDPELEPFVGVWAATSLVQTSVDNPDKSVDLINGGASFTLEIRENGQYESVLAFLCDEDGTNCNTATENGRVEVEGQQLLFYAQPDQADPATYQLSGSSLTLEGSSTYNFQDGEGSVPTTLHIELTRQ